MLRRGFWLCILVKLPWKELGVTWLMAVMGVWLLWVVGCVRGGGFEFFCWALVMMLLGGFVLFCVARWDLTPKRCRFRTVLVLCFLFNLQNN